jgi:RimJ/RimL family protein N-acetyltransferase
MSTGLVFRSERLDFLSPLEEHDEELFQVFTDPKTMLPHLQMLYEGMTRENFRQRREMHRNDWKEGASFFLDIKLRSSGKVIGTTGHRAFFHSGCIEQASMCSLKSEIAEWGIIIGKLWQRQGFCKESFDSLIYYTRNPATINEKDIDCEIYSPPEGCMKNINKILATTLQDNTAMVAFLEMAGFQREIDDNDELNAWQKWTLSMT